MMRNDTMEKTLKIHLKIIENKKQKEAPNYLETFGRNNFN